jgi:hypothetical protein
VDTSGDLSQFVDGAGQFFDGTGQLLFDLNQVGWHGGLDGPEGEGQGHQTLLCSVVEVPLDPAAGFVGGGHDPGPGGGELGAAVSVGNGGGNKVGELGQPDLQAGPQLSRLRPEGADHSPQPALDGNRGADCRMHPQLASQVRRRAMIFVRLHVEGAAPAPHPTEQIVTSDRNAPADAHRSDVAPFRHDGGRAVRPVLEQLRARRPHKAGHLATDRLEQLRRRR